MLLLTNVLSHQGKLIFQSHFKRIDISKPNITSLFLLFVCNFIILPVKIFIFCLITVMLVPNYNNGIEMKWGEIGNTLQ